MPFRLARVRMLEKDHWLSTDFQWSFGFDIRSADSRLGGSECQIRFTGIRSGVCDSSPALATARARSQADGDFQARTYTNQKIIDQVPDGARGRRSESITVPF